MLPTTNKTRIEGGPIGGALMGGIGLVMTGLGAMSVYFVVREHPEPHGSWVSFVFVLIGAWLLYASWSMYRQRARIGQLTLRLADLQPRAGGRLRGLIEFDRAPIDHEYELLLICERHYSRGKNQHTDRLWEKELRIAPASNRIAFEFHPSADAPVSESPGNGACEWHLVLKSASIQTPVYFKIVLYPAVEADRQDVVVSIGEGGDTPRPSDIPPHIAVLERGMNRLRIDFSPWRNAHAAGVLLLVGTCFAGIAGFLFSQDGGAVLLMGCIFGPVSVAALYFGLRFLWQPCSVEIEHGKLKVRHAHLFGAADDGCTTAEIDRLFATVGYSTARTGFEQAYYKLNVVTRQGRRIDVGNGIPSSWVAESLLAQMHEVVGDSARVVPLENVAKNVKLLAATASKEA
ncbi:MAG TPA: hypothetical protein VJM53_10750 [Burkholderiales bacterium]|nr:hypothetical protein [Burkholderiales bacterium]